MRPMESADRLRRLYPPTTPLAPVPALRAGSLFLRGFAPTSQGLRPYGPGCARAYPSGLVGIHLYRHCRYRCGRIGCADCIRPPSLWRQSLRYAPGTGDWRLATGDWRLATGGPMSRYSLFASRCSLLAIRHSLLAFRHSLLAIHRSCCPRKPRGAEKSNHQAAGCTKKNLLRRQQTAPGPEQQ